ncbi:MAG: hypothetical protein H7Z14_10475 [Anaerolineae bacterium]|nr:hypothetical protein [Phycisphaerae bacterium]
MNASRPILQTTPWTPIILAAALAMSLQLIATARYGAGLSPDSAVYLQSARQLASGKGFTQLFADPGHPNKVVPVTWFPPAYPALLALGMKLGIDPIQVARYSAAVLLGLYVALATTVVSRATRSMKITAIAALTICITTDQLEAFSFALSEPLFNVALLLALIALARFIERPRTILLFAAAICVSIAGMTRYIGLILAPMGALILILSQPRMPPARRAVQAGLFFLVAIGANIAWFFRNAGAGGTSTGRTIEWHPVNWSHGQALVAVMGRWIAPEFLAPHVWWLIALIVAIIAVFTPAAVTEPEAVVPARQPSSIALVFGAFAPTYLLGLALSISWIDAATPIDYRLLSPLVVPLVVLGAIAVHRSRGRGRFAMVVPIIAIAMLATNLLRTPSWVWSANRIGGRLAYASIRWEKSPVMRILRDVPSDLPIWTNVPDATSLHARRVDTLIPSGYSRDGKQPREDYPAGIESLREWILNNGGAVVLFEGPLRRSMPKAADLTRDLHELVRIEYLPDAIIWAHPSAVKYFPAARNPRTIPGR